MSASMLRPLEGDEGCAALLRVALRRGHRPEDLVGGLVQRFGVEVVERVYRAEGLGEIVGYP